MKFMSFTFQLKAYTSRIDKQISLIKVELNQKQGIFFRTHKYTVEEILKSDSLGKLYSIAEKISDDVMSWNQQGKVLPEDIESYIEFENDLQSKIDILLKQIQERKKTVWEQIKGPINEFFDIFWSVLPGYIKTLTQSLLPALSSDIKALPQSKDSKK